MKRARDGHHDHDHQAEQETPPPPPPRNVFVAAAESSSRSPFAPASVAVAAGTTWSMMNGDLEPDDNGGGDVPPPPPLRNRFASSHVSTTSPSAISASIAVPTGSSWSPAMDKGGEGGDGRDAPPPPPPRKGLAVTNGVSTDLPPPPPPRNTYAVNGSPNRPQAVVVRSTWSRTYSSVQPHECGSSGWGSGGGGGGSGSVANVFSGSSPGSSSDTSISSSAPSYAPQKRPKSGMSPKVGWRAMADEILGKAGIGRGGENPGAGARGALDAVTAGVASGASRRQQPGGQAAAASRSRRKFAVVCAANFNRSMMAHELLRKHNFQVESYGTSRDLRLPGKDIASPEVFPFGTPYLHLYDTLKRKDEAFFVKNNLLQLAARNATIKAAPQRFQDIEGLDMADFDVVLCFEARVFYSVVEDLQSRDPETFKPLHVINMTINDSFEESAAASGNVLELCRTLDALCKLEDEAAGVLEAFTRKTKRSVLHQVCHV